jgi:hypothetical protein
MQNSMKTVLALCATVAVLPLNAQIPATFKNLQVPKDIPRAELVMAMRTFAGSLGVRCTHCHVGPDNLVGMDFATDEKPSKRAARVMMQMVNTMNADFMSKVPPREGARMKISCLTCHRAQTRPPQPLDEILYETALAQGVPAAIKQFREYRDQFRDSGLYDFRDRTLGVLATRLLDNKKPKEALAAFQAAIDEFPKSVNALISAGQLAATLGERTAAEGYFRRVLEIDPQNGLALKGLDLLKPRQ